MLYITIQLILIVIYGCSIMVKITNMFKVRAKIGVGVALSIPIDIFSFALVSMFWGMICGMGGGGLWHSF